MNNMELTKKIIFDQVKKYPKLQVQDILKALYQSEFGCSHFISDDKSGMELLIKELESVYDGSHNKEFVEPLGDRFSRVHIGLLEKNGLKPDTLFKLFKLTSQVDSGIKDNFLKKLDCFQEMCLSNEIDFDFKEVSDFIINYKREDCPAVHHTSIFRENYEPAYRLISKELCRLLPIFAKIDSLLSQQDRAIISIDGACASGKTTLASIIESVYDCNIFHMDNFFLQTHQRTTERFDEAGGNVDYERFYDEVLQFIKTAKEFSYRPYDCRTQSLCKPVDVTPKLLNIVEGVYSMHPSLRTSYDFSVFMSIDKDIQSERILVRNGGLMQKRFIEEWIPLETKYFDELKIAEKCDIILDGGINFESNSNRRSGGENGTSYCGANKKF